MQTHPHELVTPPRGHLSHLKHFCAFCFPCLSTFLSPVWLFSHHRNFINQKAKKKKTNTEQISDDSESLSLKIFSTYTRVDMFIRPHKAAPAFPAFFHSWLLFRVFFICVYVAQHSFFGVNRLRNDISRAPNGFSLYFSVTEKPFRASKQARIMGPIYIYI